MLWHLPHINVPALQAAVDIIPYHIISQNTSTTISHLLQHPTPPCYYGNQSPTLLWLPPKLSQQQIPHFIMGSPKAIRNNHPPSHCRIFSPIVFRIENTPPLPLEIETLPHHCISPTL